MGINMPNSGLDKNKFNKNVNPNNISNIENHVHDIKNIKTKSNNKQVEVENLDMSATTENETTTSSTNNFKNYVNKEKNNHSVLSHLIYDKKDDNSWLPESTSIIIDYFTKGLLKEKDFEVLKHCKDNGISIDYKTVDSVKYKDNNSWVVLKNGTKIVLTDNKITQVYNDKIFVEYTDVNNYNIYCRNEEDTCYILVDDLKMLNLNITNIDRVTTKEDGTTYITFKYLDETTKKTITKTIYHLPSGRIQCQFDNGTIVQYDESGNIVASNIQGTGSANCFADYNKNSLQFGGSQMVFRDNVATLLEDPKIINSIREYFPDASLEDCELYLYKICNTGCGYTAVANGIFQTYQGREQDFLNDFGFPMYEVNNNGELDYNYEYLILDWFNYNWGNSGYTIQEISANMDSNVNDGAISKEEIEGVNTGSTWNIYKKLPNYLKEKYNINYTINEYNYDKISKEDIIQELNNPNSSIFVGCSNYDLYSLDGELKNEDGGGHAMTIVGINENGNFIVSSWGKEYILDTSKVKERGGHIDIRVIKSIN